MKKLLLLMLSAFFAFSCATDNNGGDNGKDPQNPDKPKPLEMKYVSKITQTVIYTSPVEEEEITQMGFEYDAQNRVVKMNAVLTEDQQVNSVAIQYETGKVKAIVSGSWTEGSQMVDGVLVPGEKKSFKNTATGTLNADGYIEAGEYIYTVTGDKDRKTVWSNTYNEGYLQRITTVEDEEEPYVDNCLWAAGNMISITDNKGETRSTATYDTKNLNNPKCNLDLNWIVYYDEFFATLDDSVFDVLGYYGKRSANMVASSKNEYDDYTYEYTYDAAGFVTKVVSKNGKTNKIKETMVVEYK